MVDIQLIHILQCPYCDVSSSLVQETISCNNNYIREGTLKCTRCNRIFPVMNGIPDLVPESDDVNREREGNRQFLEQYRKDKTDEWLLRLPESDDFGDDVKGNRDLLVNVEKTMDMMKPVTGYVLDLGAGTCWTSWKLAARGFKTIAVDISLEKNVGLESGEVYMTYHKVYFDRILADMTRLPFLDSSFDYVFASTAIHHAQYPDRVFNEIARLLTPGGKLYAVGEPNRPVWFIFPGLYTCITHKYHKGKSLRHEGCYSIPEWKRFCRQAGLASRFYIPPHALEIMEGKTEMTSAHPLWKKSIAGLFRRIPKMNVIRNILFSVGLYIAGVAFVLEAKKKR